MLFHRTTVSGLSKSHCTSGPDGEKGKKKKSSKRDGAVPLDERGIPGSSGSWEGELLRQQKAPEGTAPATAWPLFLGLVGHSLKQDRSPEHQGEPPRQQEEQDQGSGEQADDGFRSRALAVVQAEDGEAERQPGHREAQEQGDPEVGLHRL